MRMGILHVCGNGAVTLANATPVYEVCRVHRMSADRTADRVAVNTVALVGT